MWSIKLLQQNKKKFQTKVKYHFVSNFLASGKKEVIFRKAKTWILILHAIIIFVLLIALLKYHFGDKPYELTGLSGAFEKLADNLDANVVMGVELNYCRTDF